MAAARTEQLQAMVDAVRQSLTEVTTAVVSLCTAANASAAAVTNLTSTSDDAWDRQTRCLEQIDSKIDESQGQVRHGGGAGRSEDREWNFVHKGDLREFNGDKKVFKAWSKKLARFSVT